LRVAASSTRAGADSLLIVQIRLLAGNILLK
jgi:hypothetical protein